MMDFPLFVYKKSSVKGSLIPFKTLLVKDEKQYSAAIGGGEWFASVPEALAEKAEQPKQEKADIPGDEDQPNREELEAKATELGLKFDGRTSDRKLGVLISEALGE
jgi:hypothetical protein